MVSPHPNPRAQPGWAPASCLCPPHGTRALPRGSPQPRPLPGGGSGPALALPCSHERCGAARLTSRSPPATWTSSPKTTRRRRWSCWPRLPQPWPGMTSPCPEAQRAGSLARVCVSLQHSAVSQPPMSAGLGLGLLERVKLGFQLCPLHSTSLLAKVCLLSAALARAWLVSCALPCRSCQLREPLGFCSGWDSSDPDSGP